MRIFVLHFQALSIKLKIVGIIFETTYQFANVCDFDEFRLSYISDAYKKNCDCIFVIFLLLQELLLKNLVLYILAF